MRKDSRASVSTAALFVWHIPFAHNAAQKTLEATREANLQAALAELSGKSKAAVALITSKAPKRSADFEALLNTKTQEPDSQLDPAREQGLAKLDPIVQAALQMHFSLFLMDQVAKPAATTSLGARTSTSALETALEQITLSLQAVDREARYLALSHAEAEISGPTNPASALPPEIFAAVTTTYIRACLMNGYQEIALQAQEELDQRLDSITLDHVKAFALRTSAITYIALNKPKEAALLAQRALSIARQNRDLVSQWQAQRIRAHAASVSGRKFAEEKAHADTAKLARTLADGLDTEPEIRREASLSELESRSIVAGRLIEIREFDAAIKELKLLDQRLKRAKAGFDVEAKQLELFTMNLESLAKQLQEACGGK